MKSLYKKSWCRGLQKVGIGVLTLFGVTQGLNAQVSAYSFTQNTGTFTSISPTGTLVTGSDASTGTTNDGAGWQVTIPFSFNFNGIDYTSIYVNSNGGATFGATTSTSSTVISSNTGYSGSIGVMNRDLWGVFITSGVTTSGSNVITNVASFKGIEVGKALNNVNGIPTGATIASFDETAGTITMSAAATSSSSSAVVRYGSGKVFTSVIGTAPNRVFVIEWIGYNDYSTGVTGSNHLNFQLRLEETSNVISTVYGPSYNVNTTVRTNEIGLRGISNSDFNNRSGSATTAWSATTAGTVSSASVSRDNTNFPASGLTFTWSPPTCIAPSGVSASNIMTNTASISWTPSSTVAANGYEYYYSTTNTAPTSTTTPSGVSSTTSASLSGLSPATIYYVWVRSLCSSTDISGWSVQGTFTTACNPVATLSENFDSYATGSIVPSCWARIVTGSSASQTITSTTPASGTRNIYQYNSTAGQVSIVVLPELSTINSGYQLRFKVRATSAALLDIGYLTNPTDASTFVNIQTLNISNTSYGADSKIVFPTTVPASARVAVRMPVQTSAPSVYWDDVVWEIAPSCVEPTSVAFSNITSSGANISWSVPAIVPANGYEYYYSTTNTAPTATTVASGTSTTASAPLSGLATSTTYYVWVRSVCTSTDKSVWSTSGSFTTLCVAVNAPYTENFDTTTVGSSTNTNAPNCWKYLEPTGWAGYGYVATTAFTSAPNGYYIYTDAATTGGGMLVSPTTTNLMNGNNRVRFSANAGGSNYTMEVGTLSDPNDASTFVAIGTAINLTTTMSQYTVNIPSGTNQYLALRHAGGGSYRSVRFDDINVELIPACVEPTSVVVSAITTNDATLAWTAPSTAPANGYQIYYSTTNTAPTATTTPTLSVTTATTPLSSLTPATVYYVWVRSNCGSTQSAWTPMVTFTTLAMPPANDACSNAVTLIPGATFSQNPVVGTTVGSTNTPTLTASCLVTPTNVGGNVWYKVTVPSSGNLTIETDATSPASPLTDTVLSVFTDCSSTTSIICDDDTGNGNFSKVSLTGQTPGATLYVSIWKYSTATDGAFQVSAYDASLSTSEAANITKNNIKAYPNPFADVLNISDVSNVKSISVVDLSGKLVKTFEKPESTLYLRELNSGMYLVILNMKDGSKQTIKAIKK